MMRAVVRTKQRDKPTRNPQQPQDTELKKLQDEARKELARRARREVQRRAAQSKLSDFILYTYPGYIMGWFHKEISDTLDRFLQDVKEGKGPRLIITAPPRSGKSEIVSRRFPAYALGRNPDLEIMFVSYGADLAFSMNRDVQLVMDAPEYHEVFPDTTLQGSPYCQKSPHKYARTTDYFEVVNHRGKYRSTGIGGGITGMGAHILIIDDPVKNREDANSLTKRNIAWNWYTSTAYTRLAPGGGVIVMCTRWHCDDLAGRLITKSEQGDGDKFQLINYPAIAKHDEPHRKKGEALHPERYPLKVLEQIRLTSGERDFRALYQQEPIPDGGGMFKEPWIRYYKDSEVPVRFDKMVVSWDMTFKDSKTSDYVVGQVWGRHGANFYLLDQIRGQMDFVKTMDAFLTMSRRHPHVLRKLVEDKANGPAIISALKNKVSGIVPITPKESKEARANSVTTLWEAGNVFLPDPKQHPWVEREFVPELLSFPSGVHDDQVDAMTQALNDMKNGVLRIDASNLDYLGLR